MKKDTNINYINKKEYDKKNRVSFCKWFPTSIKYKLWARLCGVCSIFSKDILVFKENPKTKPITKNTQIILMKSVGLPYILKGVYCD